MTENTTGQLMKHCVRGMAHEATGDGRSGGTEGMLLKAECIMLVTFLGNGNWAFRESMELMICFSGYELSSI